jgi:MinD superfamily P-loop ATPase
MIRIAVLSGKGGTGKTVVTAAFAHLASPPLILADCDVDAANLHLLLSARTLHTEPFYGMKKAMIDRSRCTQCGACIKACRFQALSLEDLRIYMDPIRCEGCGVCTLICPEKAITMAHQKDGEILHSITPYGPLYHAELEPGSGNSGLLVHEVKKRALLACTDHTLLLIDGPPGIGCPVISTLSGMDAVILVTEPSVSGLHDLERLMNLAQGFDLQMMVVINRYDLDREATEDMIARCRSQRVVVLGTVPFDVQVYASVQEGKPVTCSPSPASDAIREIWDVLTEELEKMGEEQ